MTVNNKKDEFKNRVLKMKMKINYRIIIYLANIIIKLMI